MHLSVNPPNLCEQNLTPITNTGVGKVIFSIPFSLFCFHNDRNLKTKIRKYWKTFSNTVEKDAFSGVNIFGSLRHQKISLFIAFNSLLDIMVCKRIYV